MKKVIMAAALSSFMYLSGFAQEEKNAEMAPPVGPHNGIYDNGNEFKLNIYPNPASDFLIISMDLKSEAKVKVSLIEVNGKIIKEWISDIKDMHGVPVIYDIEEVPGGVYMVKFAVDNISIIRKVIIK
jgi:hypothetical protein